MTSAISIRPSKDLRTNYAQISALSRENPVAITVNGKEDTVVLCHDDFVEQQNYIMGRFIPKDAAVSYLTDSLTGILKEEYDLDEAKSERLMEKYGIAD